MNVISSFHVIFLIMIDHIIKDIMADNKKFADLSKKNNYILLIPVGKLLLKLQSFVIMALINKNI